MSSFLVNEAKKSKRDLETVEADKARLVKTCEDLKAIDASRGRVPVSNAELKSLREKVNDLQGKVQDADKEVKGAKQQSDSHKKELQRGIAENVEKEKAWKAEVEALRKRVVSSIIGDPTGTLTVTGSVQKVAIYATTTITARTV